MKISKRNLYCWRMADFIPYIKIGRAVRFQEPEVDAALERMRMIGVAAGIQAGGLILSHTGFWNRKGMRSHFSSISRG